MRTPKAIQLLKLLSSKELEDLRTKLTQSNHDRLLTLLNFLSEHPDYFEKNHPRENTFQLLFGQPYSKKKDYLLRNEFRLLTQKIEEFIIEAAFYREIRKNKLVRNYYLLRALQHRKAYELFRAEFDETYEKALKNADHFAAWAVSGLNFVNYGHLMHEKDAHKELALRMNEMKLVHLNSFYVTAYRNYQVNRAYLRQIEFPFITGELIPAQRAGTSKNEFAQYLLKKAESYQATPARRAEIMEECLEIARDRAADQPVYEGEIKYCLAELAMLHSLMLNFETAEVYFRAFFALDLETHDPYRLAVLTDYIAKLIKQRRVEEALNWIRSHRDDIHSIEKLKVRLQCLEAAAYAFSKDTEKLYRVLPENFADFSRPVRYFFRLHYAIHAWLVENEDQAVRELDNLLNVLQKGEPPVFDVRPVARFMRRYFNSAKSLSGASRDQQLKKLQSDLEQYASEAAPVYKSYLPLLWLKSELAA